MRASYPKKKINIFLIVSLFLQLTFAFSPLAVFAQSAGGSATAGAGFNAGGMVGGIAGSAVACTNAAGKLNQLIGGTTSVSTVPTNDPSNDLRENCLKKITKDIVNKILDKITLATVDWINGGFEGSPLYVENPEQFFGDMARKEINSVTGWFTCSGASNCENYPFGRLVMGQILTSLQNQAQQNLQFSLNQVLAHGSYEDFRVNFNVGGWAGYSAFLEPQNNPFGNYLLVNSELGRRAGGTTVNIGRKFNDQLAQSGGYLSPRVCDQSGTGNNDYIPENNDLHLGGYSTVSTYAQLDDLTLPVAVQSEIDDFDNEADAVDAYNSLVLRSQCKVWRTTTPGQVVGTRLTRALDTGTDQLVAADDFAENIGLIFDALINQLIQAGIRELGSNTTNGQTSVLLAQVNGQQPGAVANNQAPPSGTDAILGTGPAGVADIPLIEVQNQYIESAEAALPLLDELVKKIRALDYCVPGPNPRWLQTATDNFNVVVASITPPSSSTLPNQIQQYYKNRIQQLTGATVVQNSVMIDYNSFVSYMQEVFNRYTTRMLQNYSETSAPPTTRFFLEGLFSNMDVYNTELAGLNEYLANITPLLVTVSQIQASLEAIAAANNGVLNPSNPQVQAQMSIFNSISDHLATQNQLSVLNDRIEVYQTQILVLNDHLNSCIAETVIGPYISPNERMPYASTLPIFPYPGLPGPDSTFLPGVSFGNGSSDIDIEIGSVQVQSSSNGLSTFEPLLESIY